MDKEPAPPAEPPPGGRPEPRELVEAGRRDARLSARMRRHDRK